MARYVYKARDAAGHLSAGTIDAADELEVAAKLSKVGHFLIQAKETAPQKPLRASLKQGRLTQKELLTFTVNLATLLNAGIPLLEGLSSLGYDVGSPRARAVIADLGKRIQAGSSLKDSLAASPASFPELYQALVGVGEATGKLDGVLNDLAQMLEWQLDLRSKLREVMTYPTILGLVMLGVVTLMVIKVIPMFKSVLGAVGVALPLPTQLALAVSDLAQRWWPLAVAQLGVLAVLIAVVNRTDRGRLLLDSAKLRVPLFGPLLQKIVLSRFCRTLSVCLNAGLNAIESLRLSMKAAGNAKVAHAVERAETAIRTGQGLRDAMAQTGVFPPLVLRMVAVGEQSGKLGQCLEKVNQFYDREIPATIRMVFALFEPIMIVCIGLVVGGIALALFLPLFRLTQALGGP